MSLPYSDEATQSGIEAQGYVSKLEMVPGPSVDCLLDGKPNSDFQLVLFLSDFMCHDCANALPGCTDAMIKITADELCDIYTEGVKNHICVSQKRRRGWPGCLGSVSEVKMLSGADLENYCVTIFSSPEKGVEEDAEEWKKNMLAEKEALEKKRLLAAAGRKD
ncbi:hypothetical protein F5883DRAFT_653685 [Diaporthe sp. PMI_573]|nr:hypothetical protein F5883DRAFT_653685 [Diaporthaceae sp. PMI_573]